MYEDDKVAKALDLAIVAITVLLILTGAPAFGYAVSVAVRPSGEADLGYWFSVGTLLVIAPAVVAVNVFRLKCEIDKRRAYREAACAARESARRNP